LPVGLRPADDLVLDVGNVHDVEHLVEITFTSHNENQEHHYIPVAHYYRGA
jgi:hypothetical protein